MATQISSSNQAAKMTGILFIMGTIAGILSVIFTGSILGGEDYLVKIQTHENKIIIGALCVLIMGFTLAMVPILLFPILKKQNEFLALGYVVFRGGLETLTYIAIASSWLLLIPLSHGYAAAGTPPAPYLLTLGTLLLNAAEISATTTALVFPIGAVMLYVLLYRSKLIPPWLSLWGLIGVILHFAASGVSGMFTLASPMSTFENILAFPIFLQEMVMAVWLIVKGFNSVAIASLSAKTAANGIK